MHLSGGDLITWRMPAAGYQFPSIHLTRLRRSELTNAWASMSSNRGAGSTIVTVAPNTGRTARSTVVERDPGSCHRRQVPGGRSGCSGGATRLFNIV